MSGQVWQRQQVLAEQYRVVTFDLRGHGYSMVPPGGMEGFAGYAGDLVDLMEALDLQDAVLVGWSLGAQVLLKAFEEIAARVAGIVLVGATPRFTAAPHFPFGLPPKEAEGMRLKIRRNLERTLDGFHRQLFMAGELDNPQLQETVQAILAGVPVPSAAAALDGLEALMTAEMQHEAASVSCPALLLHGDQDPICLPQASAWLAEQMPPAVGCCIMIAAMPRFLVERINSTMICASLWRDSMHGIDRGRVERSFHRGAGQYDQHTPVQQRVVQRLLERLSAELSQEPQRVLDIGCGTGQLLQQLAQRYPQAKLTGLDLAPNMLQQAAERLGNGAELLQGDAERLPGKDNSFDLVVSTSTFQWLEECATCFGEVRRVLEPGGLFCFALFGDGTLFELQNSWRGALQRNDRPVR